ncbi:MAG TPA: ABC transporter ATP-binding protein [Candidatus Pullichristensenella avicola]|nr:ABC transporter ATP-binding protein [Candidatus Pullichristensenella avicola]
MLEIRDLNKRFDDADVLRGVSLTIETGEFVTLLGPSGCGKTTTLRIVAGLTEPDAGRVLLDGRDITALPPEKRDVNTVFQSYALFPHMNVGKNIAYGLRVRGVNKAERERRVRAMLRLVALEGFEKRMPSQLSGGQRQRIAIARALVLQPKLLLLDEPLGALDLKLRQQMQRELKDIQKRSGIAFLYVTHDQEEALNLSDRIAIMRDGLIEQIGAPEDVYERPQTRFAAEFIGQSNFLPCKVAETPCGAPMLERDGLRFPGRAGYPELRPGDAVEVCLRIERVRLSRAPIGPCALPGVLKSRHYAGGSIRETAVLPDGLEVFAIQQSSGEERLEEGEPVYVCWDPNEAALVR